MPRLRDMDEVQRNRILMRPVPVNDDPPWTKAPSVTNGRLALVTTAGVHHRDDTPFVKYDQTFRTIDSRIREADILQSQSSIGFDRSLRMRDINVVFPIDRLRELAADGTIGSLAPHYYSLVGAQEDSERTAETIGGQLAPLLHAEGIELVLITPSCPVCTHTGAALARVLEGNGFATVAISLVRAYTEKIRPPRSVFVPFPFGAPVGLPGNRQQQLSVLRIALETFAVSAGPVLVDVEAEVPAGYSPGPVQASAVARGQPAAVDVATEASMMRRYYERWLDQHGNTTAVGLTRIPVVRFRGIVRFLQALLEGDADMRERPADVSLADFIRYCSDDLKAMYLEGRMAMKPTETPDEAARWLWGETAIGDLLTRVRDRMAQSDDGSIRDAAFGIAR